MYHRQSEKGNLRNPTFVVFFILKLTLVVIVQGFYLKPTYILACRILVALEDVRIRKHSYL